MTYSFSRHTHTHAHTGCENMPISIVLEQNGHEANTVVCIQQRHAPQPFGLRCQCVHYVLQNQFPPKFLHLLSHWRIFNRISSYSTKFSAFYSIFVRFVAKFIAQTFYASHRNGLVANQLKTIFVPDGPQNEVCGGGTLNRQVNIGKNRRKQR